MNYSTTKNIKRWLTLLLLVISAGMANAVDVTIEGVTYTLDTSSASVKGYTSAISKDVAIPSTITYGDKEYMVTIINQSAFLNCTKLESISIPGTVTRIGVVEYTNSPNEDNFRNYKSVFKGCSGLKNIRFEDGLEELKLASSFYRYPGIGLFANCPLEELYLGRNISYIQYTSYGFNSCPEYYGYSAFYNQKNLKKVTIGSNVTSIPQYAFAGCSNLTDVIALANMPASLESTTFSQYTAKLLVPNSAETKYSSADYWKEFTDRMGMISQGDLIFVPNGESSVAVTKYPGASPEQIIVPASVEEGTKTFSVTEVMPGAFKSCEDLTLVSLPSSVTEVGENAFAYNLKLASLTFNGQKNLGKGAFRNCPSITSLTLPNSLLSIGESAFYNCTGITSISFGTGLTAIGEKSFAGCSALTAIRLPEGVETIGKSAFEDCIKLTYASLGSSLANLDNRAFFNCKVLTEIEIPGTTATVGASAFEKCANLSLATLNNGTLTLGENTFKDCESLLTVSVPGTVTSIGNGSFDNCISLSSVTFTAGADTIAIPHFQDSPLKTLRIGRNLVYSYGETSAPFRNKTTLTRVAFTGNYVTNLYYNLFDGCSGITSITLPSTLKTINDRAFTRCTGLTSIEVPEGVTEVGGYTFESCTSLKSASLPTTLPVLETYLFHDCTALESILLHEGVTTLKSHCFDNCTVLGGISIPSTTTSIEDFCFEKCQSLKDLTFVDGAEPIQLASTRSMFRDCPLVTMFVGRNIDYDESKVENVPFYNRDKLTTVIISDKGDVAYLRNYFLYGASALPALNIPDNVANIGKYAFANCSKMESIGLSNTLSILNEGLLQNDVSLKTLIIPAAVKTVDKYVIGNCTSLAELHFNDSPDPIFTDICVDEKGMCAESALETLYIGRNIDYDATSASGFSPFYALTNLKNISFTNKGHVTRCDNYYFKGCSAAESLYLPESLVSVGDWAFMDMTALNFCRMYNNVETVGQYGFANDESLVDLTFSTKVKTLRNNLFQNCTALPKFTVHPAVTSIENNAFMNTTSLASMTFTDSSDLLNVGRRVENDEYAAMFSDSPLESLYLSRWLIYNIDADSYAPFYNRDRLTDLRFGNTLGDIGKYLFEKCTALESTNIPGVESIGEKAFYDCSMLKDLTFNEGTRSIGEQTFANCVSLQNVKLPSTVVSVSDGCFMNDSKMATLDLGNSLEIIGPSAFLGCSSLQELNLPKTLYGLGVESFKGCTSLSYLTIPSGGSLSSIGARSFQNCSGIEWISLSEKITSIGANTFDGCNAIRYIKSFNTVPPVGLPNFAQTVLDNATVFVPSEVVDDYKDADVWWEFFDIRGIGDGVFVSYLNIDKEAATLKATQTVRITAEAGPAEASDCEVGFLSDNMEVAVVDNTGEVTAVAVGDANIKAYAKDGSGYYKICKITVVPTLMETLAISETNMEIKVNRKAQLSATVSPVTTTNKTLVWRSDNSSIASVDENGEITTHNKGTAKITVTAADGSGVLANCELKVIPPTKGDSNDNDEVTVTDAVNTANYAVGNEVENFCFEAADVNEDNKITLSDAAGTIEEVLNQPVPTDAMKAQRMNRAPRAYDLDKLIVDDFICKRGESTLVEVKLDNSVDYVALQADITLSEGMVLEKVEAGSRSEAYHSLMHRMIGNNTVRIALFSLDNTEFADNDEAILKLTVKTADSDGNEIKLNNILASDFKGNEYVLTSTGGNGNGSTGIDSVYGDGSISVIASEFGVTVYNAEGKTIEIYTVEGAKVFSFEAESNAVSRKLGNGVYVVTVGDFAAKVIVK